MYYCFCYDFLLHTFVSLGQVLQKANVISRCLSDKIFLTGLAQIPQLAHKQQKLIVHSSGAGKSETRVLVWAVSSANFLVTEGCLPSVSSHAGAGSKALNVSSYKDANPIRESSTLVIILPPKGPTSETSYLRLGECYGDTSIPSMTSLLRTCKLALF